MTEALLKAGADPNIYNDEAIRPLDWAKSNGCQEIVKLLTK